MPKHENLPKVPRILKVVRKYFEYTQRLFQEYSYPNETS